MWLARYTGFRQPNSHVSSGGLGTMGFAVPAAMGAALGRPDRETWAIVGDGGFQMTFQELMTLVQDQIPVKIALFDNKKLGMIRQWQEIIYAGNYHSSHLLGPGLRSSSPTPTASRPSGRARRTRSTRRSAAAQAVDGPALIWFEIAEEQNVFPMMPAGKGLSDLIEKWGSRTNERRPESTASAGAGRPRPAPAHTAPPPRALPGRRRGSAATSSSRSSSTSPAS